MLFLPAQVLKGGFVTSWTPHTPSLVFEQKYPCRKCILRGTGIPSTPRRACPEQAPWWLGNTSAAQEWTLCSWLLGRRRGESWANPPWGPTEAQQSPLHTETTPGLAGMLLLLLCEDSRSWHTNTMNCSLLLGVGPFCSGMFFIWVYCLGFYWPREKICENQDCLHRLVLCV